MTSLIFGLILLVIYGCGNKKNDQTTNDFVYDDGNNKIEFIIDDGKNYLILGKPTKAKFEYNDSLKFAVSGPGIKILKSTKNTMNVEITAIDGTLIDNELKVNINARIGGERITHNFGIPVRKTE